MRCLAPVLLAMTIGPASASDLVGIDWQLLAIDGQVVDLSSDALLRFSAEGGVSGKAPCNSFSASSPATLPALDLRAIRVTRMACPDLDKERQFFDALAKMASLRVDGQNLILTGPEGQTMEFVHDLTDGQPRCLTCPPKN